jgi:hypothetical protein
MIRYTPNYLSRLEELLKENQYTLRNERGNFKSGFCLLQDQRVVVVNKFATVENRVNALIEILKELRTKENLTENPLLELKKVTGREPKKVSG